MTTPLRTRIVAALSVSSLIIAVLAVFAFQSLDIRKEAVDVTEDSLPTILYVTEIESLAGQNYGLTMRDLVASTGSGRQRDGQQIEANDRRIAELLARWTPLAPVSEPDEWALLNSVKSRVAPYRAAQQAVWNADRADASKLAVLVRNFDLTRDRLSLALHSANDYSRNAVLRDATEVLQKVRSSRIALAVAFVVAVFTGLTTLMLLLTIGRLARDILKTDTQLTEAERARQVSDERFRLIVQATSDVLWDWDIPKHTIWWSDGFETRFHHPTQGIADISSWTDNIHPDDHAAVMSSVDHAIGSGELRWASAYRFRKGDGSYAEVLDRGVITSDAEGTPVRMVGAIVDVTQYRALETQLDQIKRVSSLGQLAANMAHEFNNVLMGIQPFADVIRRKVPDRQDVQNSISRILESVARGRRVTGEILRFTRNVDPVKKRIDVRNWLIAFRTEAEALLDGRCRLEVQAGADDLQFLGDVSQLNQVMANLVLNARDASAPGDLISISAAPCVNQSFGLDRPSDYVEVIIRDEGSGMDSATLEKIFEPLFTTKRTGTGLGLAICRQVIVAHGGRIVAASVVGEGTAFHILLPSSSGFMTQMAAPPTVAVAQSPLPASVLIVDDDADGLR